MSCQSTNVLWKSERPKKKPLARFFPGSHLPGLNWGPQNYEFCALPTELRWHHSFTNSRPSNVLLLTERFFLPFPLFKAAYVGLSESQLGQSNRRLLSALLRQFPSIWSATTGTTPVTGFTCDHPHRTHLFPYFSLKYLFIWIDTIPMLCKPDTFPSFQSRMYFWC